MVMSWGWEEKVVRKENPGGFKRVANVPFPKLGSKYTGIYYYYSLYFLSVINILKHTV